MLNYFNPSNTLKVINKLQKFIFALFIAVLILGFFEALVLSPEDYKQSDSVRIMYVHVPSAWLASFLYFSLAISCVFYLVWKHPLADLVSSSIAPIGALFSALTLITGSLWGKPMWGTWWVWDARLTSMLILCIFYFAYIGISNAFPRKIDGSKPAAILAIVGMVNLPIIKFSVDWWNTLHQPASISKLSAPTIDVSMLIPLFIMTAACFLFLVTVSLIRFRLVLIENKILRTSN